MGGEHPDALENWIRQHRDPVAESTAPDTIKALFAQAGAAKRRGDVAAARHVYEEVAANPDAEIAALGECYLGLAAVTAEDGEQARLHLRRAIDSQSPLAAPMAAYYLSILLAREGEPDSAWAVIEQAAAGNPGLLAKAAANLGLGFAQRGETDAAMAAYRRAIATKEQPHALRAMLSLGNLLVRTGDTAKGETGLRFVMEAGTSATSLRAAFSLGTALEARGDLEGAREAYARAAARAYSPPAADAEVALGFVLNRLGDPAAARAAYGRALVYGERRAELGAALGLGLLERAEGRSAEAERLMRQAVDGGEQQALIPLGDLLATGGRWEEAEPLFGRAAAAGIVRALVLHGEVLDRLGREPEAEACFRQAIDAGDLTALLDLSAVLMRRCCAPQDVELARDLGYNTPGYQDYLLPLGADLAAVTRSDLPIERMAEFLHEVSPSPELDEAERLLRRAVAEGVPDAESNLSALLIATGRESEAEERLRAAVAAGDERAAGALARLLLRREPASFATPGPHIEEIIDLLGRWTATGDTRAATLQAQVLEAAGRVEEARALRRQAADAGNSMARVGVLVDLFEQGRFEDAEVFFGEIVNRADRRDLDAFEAMFSMPGAEAEVLEALRRAERTREPADVHDFIELFRTS